MFSVTVRYGCADSWLCLQSILCVSSCELSGWIALTEKRFPCPQNNPKIVGVSIRSDEHTRLLNIKLKEGEYYDKNE